MNSNTYKVDEALNGMNRQQKKTCTQYMSTQISREWKERDQELKDGNDASERDTPYIKTQERKNVLANFVRFEIDSRCISMLANGIILVLLV